MKFCMESALQIPENFLGNASEVPAIHPLPLDRPVPLLFSKSGCSPDRHPKNIQRPPLPLSYPPHTHYHSHCHRARGILSPTCHRSASHSHIPDGSPVCPQPIGLWQQFQLLSSHSDQHWPLEPGCRLLSHGSHPTPPLP